MPFYRCYIEQFVNVEAENEKKAAEKAVSALIEDVKKGNDGIVVWEITDEKKDS